MRRERTSLVMASALLLVLVAAVGFAAKGGSTQLPATAMFADRSDDRIRSDGGGIYDDTDPKVTVWVDSASGQFFFRTASRTDGYRAINLDFTDALSRQAGCNCLLGPCLVDDAFGQGDDAPDQTPDFPDTLDICGLNTVPDVRWIAGNLFGSSALSAGIPLTLRISLEPDFRYTAFELQFEQSVAVTGSGNTRVMSASSTQVAELYKYTGKGNNKLSLGRFRMPFELTVTR